MEAVKRHGERLFRSIALEHPDVRVLNYDPGRVDTALWRDIEMNTVDPRTKDIFTTPRKEGLLITPERTASVLVDVLQKDDFESGGRKVYKEEVSQ